MSIHFTYNHMCVCSVWDLTRVKHTICEHMCATVAILSIYTTLGYSEIEDIHYRYITRHRSLNNAHMPEQPNVVGEDVERCVFVVFVVCLLWIH